MRNDIDFLFRLAAVLYCASPILLAILTGSTRPRRGR